MTIAAGYDVGGAHLKIALAEDGRVLDVRQVPCPLWRGLDQLDTALANPGVQAMTRAASRHTVTMTGELADVFPDRYTGVVTIVGRLAAAFGPQTRFWMGRHGIGLAEAALARHADVASTNFLASATIAATRADRGVLIDMGSTTTDIVPFANGAIAACGLTDADRLRTGELIYTGLTRTPVMAVTTRGLFQGSWQTLARDPFATMADVRRVLGELPEGVDQHATADGRSTSEEDSRARFARCFGRDVEVRDAAEWAVAARHVREVQLRSIHDGAFQVLAARPPQGPCSVVTAGIGAHVATEVARRLDMPAVSFGELIAAPLEWRDWATRCAPAVALALLE